MISGVSCKPEWSFDGCENVEFGYSCKEVQSSPAVTAPQSARRLVAMTVDSESRQIGMPSSVCYYRSFSSSTDLADIRFVVPIVQKYWNMWEYVLKCQADPFAQEQIKHFNETNITHDISDSLTN